MLSSLISNFERIAYCLGTWKNSGVIWLGWSVEEVKCVYEKEWLISSSAVLMAVCQSWQRKWKWPQVSGFPPCCSHINDSSHCIISLPPSHLLSLVCSFCLLFSDCMWKDGWLMDLWIKKCTLRVRRKVCRARKHCRSHPKTSSTRVLFKLAFYVARYFVFSLWVRWGDTSLMSAC